LKSSDLIKNRRSTHFAKELSAGFTLMEMLIVVASIAILVAITIPVLNSQLEKSREATDLANVRSKYAEMMLLAVTGEEPTAESGISRELSGSNYLYKTTVVLTQKEKDWQSALPVVIGGVSSDDSDNWKHVPQKDGKCIITYTEGAEKAVFDWGGSYTSYTSGPLNAIVSDFGGKPTSYSTKIGATEDSELYNSIKSDLDSAYGEGNYVLQINQSTTNNKYSGYYVTYSAETTYDNLMADITGSKTYVTVNAYRYYYDKDGNLTKVIYGKAMINNKNEENGTFEFRSPSNTTTIYERQ